MDSKEGLKPGDRVKHMENGLTGVLLPDNSQSEELFRCDENCLWVETTLPDTEGTFKLSWPLRSVELVD